MIGIRMYFSNFTTDKPSVDKQSSASSTFGSGRDIAYLVFSILQFFVAVFTLILVYYIIRKKDKKDEKERLEKEERDKLADIINNEYNKIVEDGIVDKPQRMQSEISGNGHVSWKCVGNTWSKVQDYWP